MVSLYDVLKASKGLPANDPIAALWGRKLAGGKIQETEGTLPLTISANGENLIDYRIYGASGGTGERTENLFDKNFEQGLYRAVDGGKGDSSRYVRSNDKIHVSPDETYTVTYICPKEGVSRSGVGRDSFIFFWEADSSYIGFQQIMEKGNQTFTTPSNAAYVGFTIGAGSSAGDTLTPSDVSNFMLNSGSTAPTSYIPYGYQLNAVVRSENLFDYAAKDASKGYMDNRVLIDGGTNVSYAYFISEYIDVSNLELVSFFNLNLVTTPGLVHAFLDEEKNRLLNFTVTTQQATRRVPSNACYLQLSVLKTKAREITVVIGSTPPTEYIPYSRTDIPIYIGSTPLEQGEYVNYGEQKVYKYVDGVLTPTDPPVALPALPTLDGTTVIDIPENSIHYLTSNGRRFNAADGTFLLAGSTPAPDKLYVKYRKGGT